ncbi:hypothetical protein PAXRUDRAFT_802065, partial [Paxillus rubicundulus Ve08.2h10]
QQHIGAFQWISIGIILYNLVVEVEGGQHRAYFALQHGRVEEEEDRGPLKDPFEEENPDGEVKHRKLAEEWLAFQNM